jgi:thiamine pyrophosphate-dependent acetolactate synthase large subunit-like protein
MIAPPVSAAARQPTVADVVGTTLARLGVDVVFGLMGSGNLVATNALVAGGARVVTARHEGGAVAMADGYARTTGRIAAASVHQGPGLTNAMTALGEAAKARTPLLVLAGDTPAAALRSNFRIDQHDLVTSVGAIAERVYDPESAAADAARALRRALVERRPVVLNMAVDLQARPAPTGWSAAEAAAVGRTAPSSGALPPAAASLAVPPPPHPGPDPVAAAADLLARAERPVILAGRGAVLADAGDALEAVGAHAGALLATSAMAHGLFADLPYALGIAGGFATPLAAKLLPQADVVVAVGAGLNGWTTRHGALLADDVRVIRVDVEAGALDAHLDPAVAIVGDADATAGALLEALRERTPPRTGWRTPERAAEIAARRWRDEGWEDRDAEGSIDPRTLTVALDDALPAERTVVVDSGHLTGWPSMYLRVPDARAFVFVNAFQAVGLGLGAAIGAAVGRPDRLTVAAVGDGGLFLALPELETAARLRLRLLVVVYDDAAYGAEVHHFAPGGHDVALARFPDADLAAIARAAGMAAATVRRPSDLDALTDWLADGEGAGPLLLDAKVDPTVCADWLAEAFRGG